MSQNLISSLLFEINANTAAFRTALEECNDHVKGFSEGLTKLKDVAIAAFEFTAVLEAGKKLFEFSQVIGECTNKVASLSDLSGKDLANLTASIKATSDTFGTDFNETLKTTNTLSKQMGISFQDAAQLIQQGTALNETNSQDFLATVKEFTPQFKTMGLTASGTLAIISQSFKEGIGTSGVEAITKAHKALEELKQPAVDSLKAIGINADQLVLSIRDGSQTEFQAIQQISEKMKGFGADSSEVGNILVNVFGKAGVKAGASYIESLATAKTSMQDLVDETGDAEKANLRLAAANEDLDKIWVSMFGGSATAWTSLKATLTEIAVQSLQFIITKSVDIINYFIELYNNSILFRGVIQDLIFVFKNLWEYVKLVGNLIVDVFSNAGRIIKDVFTGNIKDIQASMTDFFKNVGKDAIEFGKNAGTNFIDGVKATINNKPIALIKLGDASKQGEEAGKVAADSFGEAFNDGGKNKKATKPKAEKFDLGIKTDIVGKIAKDFQNLNTQIAGVVKTAGYFPTTLQSIGNSFTKHITQNAYPAMKNLGDQIGQSVASGTADLKTLGNQVMNTAKQVLSASLSESLAEVIASAGDLPFPYDLAAIAVSTAAVSAAFSAIPAFASGGDVPPNTLYMAGEKGAELISSGSNGAHVFNNSDTGKMFSGGSGKLQVEVVGVVKGEDIYYSQQNVVRRRGNSSY